MANAPVQTEKSKNFRYITPALEMGIEEAFVRFANPSPSMPLTLIKPPIIFSKNSYSTPIALPLGLAYIASVMERSGYPVQLIDCVGRDINRIQRSEERRVGKEWKSR